MPYIDRDLALSHPFANGQYDHEHANDDFIIGHESYKEWLEQLPTTDVVERKGLDKITEVHEKIGYEKGYRDGYAQSIEDAIEVVGINTWAGSRITKLQPAQDRMVGKEKVN